MQDLLPRENLPAGYLVCRYGEPGESAYIIETGCVEVLTPEGVSIASLGAGEIFGEVALLDRQPRTASVRTLAETTLLRIDRVHVQQLLKRTDPVIRHLMTVLLERFRARSQSPLSPARRVEADDERIAKQTLMLTQDLAHAVASDQLELAYQPLVDLPWRRLLGFEALVRWRHPLLGTIVPTHLIALAEKTGLIHSLSEWVLRRAIADWPEMRRWCCRDADCVPFISVNLSAPDLSDPGIVGVVGNLLQQSDMRSGELHLELTESTLIEDREKVGNILGQLAGLGVRVALDDFGTGYAGLDCLKSLPLSCLKIDQIFVRETLGSQRSREIVSTALNLARSLGMTTIGEGIEEESVAAELQRLGCDIGQGYHFARPLALPEVAAWVAEAARLGRLRGGVEPASTEAQITAP
ncbi:MAG: EAL domain-containing protein [Azonexus sp.]|nr:EAL domain-containing protein [Azonexus sp.]MCK6413856.1 EAL domain-containing protein [Azonexus sp.]